MAGCLEALQFRILALITGILVIGAALYWMAFLQGGNPGWMQDTGIIIGAFAITLSLVIFVRPALRT